MAHGSWLMAGKNSKREFGYKAPDMQLAAMLLPIIISNTLPGLLFLEVIKHLFRSPCRIWDVRFYERFPSSREGEHMPDTTCNVDEKSLPTLATIRQNMGKASATLDMRLGTVDKQVMRFRLLRVSL